MMVFCFLRSAAGALCGESASAGGRRLFRRQGRNHAHLTGQHAARSAPSVVSQRNFGTVRILARTAPDALGAVGTGRRHRRFRGRVGQMAAPLARSADRRHLIRLRDAATVSRVSRGRRRIITSVVPSGFALAFAASVNLLLTSRAVEHFRGRHKHAARTDSDAELGAYGIANLCAGIFGAPMSVGIPARSVANVRCGGTTRLSNNMHAVFLILLVRLGSGALAHIPLAALVGVTAWMGICLLDVSAWRRLSRMRLADALGFLITAIGVLVVNAVAAVVAGCAIYAAQFLYHRYLLHPAPMAPAGVR